MKISYPLWVVLPLLLLGGPAAGADDNIAALRAELNALKTDYEARIQLLEQRLGAAEQQLAQASSTQATAPPPRSTGSSYKSASNQYNPAIGVILNGAVRSYDHDPQQQVIAGFPAGGEAGLADEGLSMGESEFVFTANVDDWFYGQVTLSMDQEDGNFNTTLEEAFLDTLSLPADATLRFGRFFSDVGYLNNKHSHTWAFADQALPYQAFMGSQYGDDGIQLRWLAPTDTYLELGGELFRGSGYPAAGNAHSGIGTRTLFVHAGGDVGFSNSWSAGLSWLGTEARGRQSGNPDQPVEFNGNSDIYIADLVWKWAPNGNIRERNLIFQTEYLRREEDGRYLLPGTGQSQTVNGDADGWYAQLIYQWRPRWRAGVRIDGLSADHASGKFAGTELDNMGRDPRRYSLMFDYSNSEFSRIRLQYNRDESGLNNDNQFTLQYIMSIGAHGAHEF